MAPLRAEEARSAWREAGIAEENLVHLPLLPQLYQPNPPVLHAAAVELRRIIDEFKPTVVIAPMFEGGHVHHDMVVGLLDEVVDNGAPFEVFEAPGYGPYVSLNHTPQRVIALCARWLFGLVSYYGPADGVDGRSVYKVRLGQADIEIGRAHV